jgi:hypothetical protein
MPLYYVKNTNCEAPHDVTFSVSCFTSQSFVFTLSVATACCGLHTVPSLYSADSLGVHRTQRNILSSPTTRLSLRYATTTTRCHNQQTALIPPQPSRRRQAREETALFKWISVLTWVRGEAGFPSGKYSPTATVTDVINRWGKKS